MDTGFFLSRGALPGTGKLTYPEVFLSAGRGNLANPAADSFAPVISEGLISD